MQLKNSIIFLFFIAMCLGQTQAQTITSFAPSFHFNTRTAKETNPFDWYYKTKIAFQFDSLYDINAFHNRERDNGRHYYSYGAKFESKYAAIEDYKDTEIDKQFISVKAYFTTELFKFGYDYSFINLKQKHSAYIAFNWRFINSECSFLQEIIKFTYNISPEIKILNKLYIGFLSEGIFIEDKFKWSNGTTIKLKL